MYPPIHARRRFEARAIPPYPGEPTQGRSQPPRSASKHLVELGYRAFIRTDFPGLKLPDLAFTRSDHLAQITDFAQQSLARHIRQGPVWCRT
jgi:hypothetical protein